ncbi:MAG TPA: ABC transporter permease, partial [Candidatus Dormibacteraeota bacterium]|nr:ABC transporter permease [Candidatus Dormibacteraeota bacterium]
MEAAETPASVRTVRRRRLTRARLARDLRRNLIAYVFLLPWLAGFFGLTLGPMLASLFLSFTKFDLLSDPRWVGTRNYLALLQDERWW